MTYVIGDPTGKNHFPYLSRGNSKNNRSGGFLRRFQIKLVEAKEYDHCRQCGSLVAVNERMVARDPNR